MTQHKPVIETIINTAAMALAAYSVVQITQDGSFTGYLPLAVAVGLELLKYWGRNKKYW